MYSRKFSSIMKNARAPSSRSASHITRKSSAPVSKKLTNFPLPPKNADVVQKLQPIGQPTDGMIVAAGLPPPRGAGNPISRKPNDDGMTGCSIGRSGSSPRILAQPRHALALHDVIGVDHRLDARNRRDVPADDDRRPRRVLPDEPAHLPDLADVDDDADEADDVVVVRRQLLDEALARRKVEQRARRRDVALNQHEAPGPVEHAQRERPLLARHLVVVQLDRIDASRLPNSSSCANGLKTEERSSLARVPFGCGCMSRPPPRSVNGPMRRDCESCGLVHAGAPVCAIKCSGQRRFTASRRVSFKTRRASGHQATTRGDSRRTPRRAARVRSSWRVRSSLQP